MTILRETRHINVRLEADDLEELQKIAAKERRSLAAIVRFAVEEYLKAKKERKAR